MKNIKLLNKKYVCEKTKMLAFKQTLLETLTIKVSHVWDVSGKKHKFVTDKKRRRRRWWRRRCDFGANDARPDTNVRQRP